MRPRYYLYKTDETLDEIAGCVSPGRPFQIKTPRTTDHYAPHFMSGRHQS